MVVPALAVSKVSSCTSFDHRLSSEMTICRDTQEEERLELHTALV